MYVSSFALVTAFSSAPAASQRPTKPPLQDNLDNLKSGLVNNIKVTQNTKEKFKADWMPKSLKHTPIPIDRHSGPTLDNVLPQKQPPTPRRPNQHHQPPPRPHPRLRPPLRLHPLGPKTTPTTSTPPSSSSANTINSPPVHLHESAHSLDLQKAYPDKTRSPPPPNGCKPTKKIPRSRPPYPQTNQIENVAQNTVVASFQKNVPGGFEGIKKQSGKIRNQYSTAIAEQKESGDLLVPGGKCRKRLPNSEAVRLGGARRVMGAAALDDVSGKPDVGIKDAEVEVVEVVLVDTREACKGTAFT